MNSATTIDSDSARHDIAVDHRYLAPPPLDMPRFWRVPRRLRSKRALAAVVAALVAIAGTGTFFTIRALTQDQSAASLAALTNQYHHEASVLDAGVTGFRTALRNATQSGDTSQLDIYANVLSSDLRYFDTALHGMRFPARFAHDADAVVAADQVLGSDLDGTSAATADPAQTFQADFSLAGQAHDTLNADLGLPPSAFGGSNVFGA